ncbi:hypothetical protein BEH94_05970 [Candidatus Altiarchaeales archaeon WOR_SM1_SCG]|nr:hypothetical protein BEH94_05970 [Candidatus Altiarchaeales archaeon WOR_SM1_SCG]
MFIDANIFLFVILRNPRYGGRCKKLLDSIRKEGIKVYTSVNAAEEVVYKTMMFELVEKYDIEFREIKSFLKKKPEVISELEKPWKALNVIKNSVKILDVKSDDLIESGKLSKRYSLLPSDSLIVAVMKRNNIGVIATTDSDFERVDGIKIWMPETS